MELVHLDDTKLTPLQTILKIRKTIPFYQRDFVWEPTLIENFLESIWDAFQERRGSYFCGSLVVFEHNGIYEIVDGQQRITVLYTLASELIMSLGKTDPNAEGEYRSNYVYGRPSNHRNPGLIAVADSEGLVFRFDHKTENIAQFYKAVGMGKQFFDDDSNTMLEGLLSCQEIVREFVKDKRKNAVPHTDHSLFAFLLEKINFVYYNASDVTEALLVYTKLNSGGKPLGFLEVIKGQLFGACGNKSDDRWEKLDKKWNDFWVTFKTQVQLGGVGKKRSGIGEDSLLSYFFLVRHTDTVRNFTGESGGFLSSAKMIEFILDKNVASELFRKPEDFVKQLTSFTEAVLNYRQGKHEDKECVEFLKDIAVLSQTQTQPLMLLMSASYSDKVFKRLLPVIMQLVFVFTTSVSGTGSTSGVWKKLSKGINDNRRNDLPEEDCAAQAVTQAREELRSFWKTHFKPRVEELRKTKIKKNNTHTKKMKTILLMVEISARRLMNLDEPKNYNAFYNKNYFDLDHLSPDEIVDPEADEWIAKIGNIALLEKPNNRAQKNRPLSDETKLANLSTSKFYTTRALVNNSDSLGQQGSIAKIMDMMSTMNSRDEELCDRRKREMFKVLERYFEID